MKKLKIELMGLLIFMGGFGLNVSGQEVDTKEEIYIRQVIGNQMLSGSVGNLFLNQATVLQFGNSNAGNITQQNAAGLFQSNIGIITQTGNYNESNLSQIGSGNRSLSTQIGSYNTAELNIEGNFNTSATLQLGNNNNFDKTITGDNQSFNLLQLGNSNTLSLGAGALPGMKVTQQGNGMSVIIR